MAGVDGVRIDLARLAAAGSTLTVVKSEFEDAKNTSRGLAHAVGSDRLADALVDFADKWDDRRADMVENIGSLAEAATAIADAFGQLDTEYAAALDGSAAPAPAPGRPGGPV